MRQAKNSFAIFEVFFQVIEKTAYRRTVSPTCWAFLLSSAGYIPYTGRCNSMRNPRIRNNFENKLEMANRNRPWAESSLEN